ncbi:MAG: histidine-type phosphatase [Nocardioides sp.]|uniref:histidine-type phosphatase n=1 Tax=Nocardioides sp. TaxID=35761 RepID=UPI0039E2F6C7
MIAMTSRRHRAPAVLVATLTAALTATVAATVAVPLLGSPADARPSAHPAAHPAAHPGARSRPDDSLTTKTPYRPRGDLDSYQRAPRGFTPVFTENVSRHGSRTMSDADDGDVVLALVQAAEDQGALTAPGRRLSSQVTAQLAVNERYGYGELSPIGDRELRRTAQRLVRRLPSVFADAVSRERPIEVSASSQSRTLDSATQFTTGLTAADPAIGDLIEPTVSDDTLLYFHKTDTAYQDYLENDSRIGEAEDAALDAPRTHRVARAVLTRFFTAAFVDRIVAGDLADAGADDEVAAAQSFYALYQNAADVPGKLAAAGYLTHAQAAWFGYLDDVESFYENGPAFAGSDVTYAMAQPLLDDMFADLEAQRDGTSDAAADLRFTHAEEIMPLATLLGLPGSTEQVSTDSPYRYADNDFRGARVAPMAANIQWDLYRSGDRYLVRMLYNERQTRFKAGCAPVAPGSYFYDLDTLEECYGYSQ